MLCQHAASRAELDVSTSHWSTLSKALSEMPASVRQSFVERATGVRSIGAFWDLFFYGVNRVWKPFPFPDSFFTAPSLKPLRTAAEMVKEGLSMRNCVGQRVRRAFLGQNAYFHRDGPEPATVQLIRKGAALARISDLLSASNTPIGPEQELVITGAAQLPGIDLDVWESCYRRYGHRRPRKAA
jgi:hypothetical protein